MIIFPKTAEFGKKIPFASLQKQGVPRRFGSLIKSIVWSYKLSPDTIGLAATKSVSEIEVIDLVVKAAGASLRARSSIMEMLNIKIPNPCIFRIASEGGDIIELAVYPKVSGGSLYGDSPVYRYARAQDIATLPSGVTTLESFLIAFTAMLSGMTVRHGESLKLFDNRHYQLESLRADLEDIKRKIAKEVQLNRKYEFAKEKQRLQKEIDYVQGA